MNEEIEIDNVAFYCKTCGQLVEVSREQKRYIFTCQTCGGKDIAFGTKKSISDFYNIKAVK
jgi:Zn finger protein HypA/HybF involved in hydrogenase expression